MSVLPRVPRIPRPPRIRAVQAPLRSRLRDPIIWNDVTQLAKTVLAAVVAWLLATSVFHLPQSFLAPWAALLVVHATVYRTFSRGLRQVTAAVLGVLLAWAISNAVGLDTGAAVLVLALGLAVGALPWFGEHNTGVAVTALIVVTTASATDDAMVSRLLDTGIGIAVGLLVNLAVWPPLRRRNAQQTKALNRWGADYVDRHLAPDASTV